MLHPSLIEKLEAAEKEFDEACRRDVVRKPDKDEIEDAAICFDYHQACYMRDLLGDALKQITRKN